MTKNVVPTNVLFISGEPSGDLHASFLIEAMKKLDNNIYIFGCGGDHSQEQGMELLAHTRDLSVMGFSEVLPAIPRLKRLERQLVDEARKRKTKLAVLIDYPGFNLSIAPKLKKLGIRVVYYISPQFWAWHEKRVEKIKRYVDQIGRAHV